MAFHVRDAETDRLVRELAQRRGLGLTETIKAAVEAELQKERETKPLWERLKHIVEPLQAYKDTDVVLDKAFYDDLSGC